MKYLGLIKWFDTEKGFGKIGTPDDGDIFIHQNNLADDPEILLIATSLVFEIEKTIQGKSAINAKPPTSYEDFQLIFSYLKRDPSISIEVPITGLTRWGNKYKSQESRLFNVISNSLNQLLRKKKATEIYEFFKNYFDEQYCKEGNDFASRYLDVTRERMFGFKVELNDDLLEEFENKGPERQKIRIPRRGWLPVRSTNKFLIQKLIAYYLPKLDTELLFEVWKNKKHLINTTRTLIGEFVIEEDAFEFPSAIFLNNHSKISPYELEQIINQSNGKRIAVEVVTKKIAEIESISFNSVNQILQSIQILSKSEDVIELRELFINRLLDLIIQSDFKEIKNESLAIFKYFIEIIKDKKNSLNFDSTIQKFNESITEEARFKLWQATRYFKPEKIFFDSHFSQLSNTDFLNAPQFVHEGYFSTALSNIEEFETIESFCLLTFLVIETPYKVLQEIFPKLPLKYQISYWLNFPKNETYFGKYYEADYKISDIPFNQRDLIIYLKSVPNLNDLLIAYELVNMIQEIYESRTSNKSSNEGFLELSEMERRNIIHELVPQAEIFTNSKLVELFKTALNRYLHEDYVLLCKVFVPKFINREVLSLDDLINIICDTGKDTNFHQDFFLYLSKRISKFERVSLWINGYIKKVDFNEVVEVFDKFQLNQQPNVLRKLFYLIQRNKINSIENCFAQLSNLEAKRDINLDVRICLTVIKSLNSEHNYIKKNKLSEIVCQYVNENVVELIKFHDLFQECNGRTWMKVGKEVHKDWYLNIEGKEFHVDGDFANVNGHKYEFDNDRKAIVIEGELYSFKWVKKENSLIETLYEKPNGVTFCDAKKSQMDEKLKRNFYWCCNSKCYAPCQTDHVHLEWDKYSLRDFIKILKLPFDDDKFYRFVSVVNRANRLLKKLNCTSCNNLLRDTKTSEFAFYRVTSFHCTNSDCSKFHEVIYLNHCLNWKCLNVVDSRISVTCPNEWYICDSCNNCCSQDKLEKRLIRLKANNAFNPQNPRHLKLEHQVENKLGHLDKEIRFNHETGKIL